MNPKVAAALNTLSMGIAELAEALNDSSDPVRSDAGQGSVPPASPAPAFEESPFIADGFEPPPGWGAGGGPLGQSTDQGSEAVCPRHKRTFRESKFAGKPAYCTAKEDDPKWSRNGFCSINADNVDKWLRQQAAA